MKKNISIILGIVVITAIIIIIFFVRNKQVNTPVSMINNTAIFDTALTTKHISTPDAIWPPVVKFSNGLFSCNSQGSDTSEIGKIELKTIAGTKYCVTSRSEGAAGSMYTTYTYTAEIKDQLATTTFVLRFVNCDNYDDPEKTICKTEREQFNPDVMANGIIFNSINGFVPVVTKSRSCYVYHQVATKTEPYAVDEYLDLVFDNEKVSGIKKGTQNGPDMTNGYVGSISGTIENGIITSIFNYTIEGSNNKEKELYKKTLTGLEKMRYPLVQEKGVLVPDITKEFKTVPYLTIDCSLVK